MRCVEPKLEYFYGCRLRRQYCRTGTNEGGTGSRKPLLTSATMRKTAREEGRRQFHVSDTVDSVFDSDEVLSDDETIGLVVELESNKPSIVPLIVAG